MKKKCIALLLAAVMLVSPSASLLAESTEQAAVEVYETTETASLEDGVTESTETVSSESSTSEAAEVISSESSTTEATESAEADSSESGSTETTESAEAISSESSTTEATESTEAISSESNSTEATETISSESSSTESTETISSESVSTESTELTETTEATEVTEATESIGTESTEEFFIDIITDDKIDEAALVTYTLSFDANGGTGTMDSQTFTSGTSANLTANVFKRDGYSFKGWALSKDGDLQWKNKAALNPDTMTWDENNSATLYAKWEAKEYKIKYKLNKGTNNKDNPSVYTIETKTIKLKNPTRSGYGFAGWYTDKNYKNKITKIKKGSTGKLTLYAKWEKEYPATSTSAKITSCKATGTNTIKVKATITKRVKSSDSYYYLVTVDPNTDKILKKVAKTDKAEKISFKLDTSENRGYALAKYAIAVKSSGKYVKISSTTKEVQNPEKLAANTSAYHLGTTKKGIQEALTSRAVETGCSNIFCNLFVSSVLNGSTPYTYNGTTYYFDTGSCSYTIREACAAGLNVTVQILLDANAYKLDSSLVAKEARSDGHNYYTWNTKDKKAREKMEAMFCFLAESYGADGCYVSNWILGNEVNADHAWNWKGSMSNDAFVSSYAYSYCALYSAVRSVRSSSRVFICLNNMWTYVNTSVGITAKTFLDTFVKKVNKLQKNVDWNVAFHPYSAYLPEPAFWRDSSCSGGFTLNDWVTNSSSSPFVTMKNINVLTDYVKKTYGKEHRIILSEIGFNAGGVSSEQKQAAAIAYAYNKAACNDMIDAFIIRSYEDEAGEAAQGLYFGIKGRAAYNVFKYMDTKKAEKYTKKYLKTCGGSSWKSLVSGYSTKKIRTNNGMK